MTHEAVAKSRRPAIPSEVVREILIESGHRCAVCGEPCPLERAHIVPWSKTRDHRPENLLCLCAGCHQRADLENWGEKTLREYKKKPWILRRYCERDAAVATRDVELTLKLNISDFSSADRRLLVFALAAFLNISPEEIEIVSVKEGSVKITLRMPADQTKRLVLAWAKGDENLFALLEPFEAEAVEPMGENEREIQLTCADLERMVLTAAKRRTSLKERLRRLFASREVERHVKECVECAAKVRFTKTIIRSTKQVGGKVRAEHITVLLKRLQEKTVAIWSRKGHSGTDRKSSKRNLA